MTGSTLLRSAGLFWYSSPNGRLVHTTGREYAGVIEAIGRCPRSCIERYAGNATEFCSSTRTLS